ncbi:hypothetical protein B0J13DRAFT_461011 [Dactylonectria estremocensis]|uniref:Uncharacterized protein n=1 Tax=Dactylonectria estremocensis TaxID=1079267 RepID=A0A9P9D5S3_9HYPO|nr:hypothetical protein B0J13DRAFT_461011 [Dactylonectria estremocensis]
MQANFFLTLIFLIARASAGEYQGAVDHLVLYYGYEIDGLNEESDRTIGFRCVRWKNGACEDDRWEACRPKPATGRTRCNFNELMVHLGKLNTDKPVLVDGSDQNTRTPKIQETAMNFVTKEKKAILNFPSYKAMKGADGDFNKYNIHLAEVVALALKHKTTANADLFDGFASSMKQAKVAQAGEHGAHLINAAKVELGTPNKMEIKTMDLGVNPVDGRNWYTVDWQATVKDAQDKGIKNAQDLVKAWQKKWYRPNPSGRPSAGMEHRVVLRTYAQAGKILSKWCA